MELFKRRNKSAPAAQQGRREDIVNTDFMNGISFEADPFQDETPTDIKVYDLNGNEVEQ